MKILIVDTLYPKFLDHFRINNFRYHDHLDVLMAECFGTFDAYSRNLRKLGWESADVILNADTLQEKWSDEFGRTGNGTFSDQIEQYDPDVIFLQDLNITLPANAAGRLIAGQCSCPWPGDSNAARLNMVFTSFPHYVSRFESLGVKAIYNPLAFDTTILDRLALFTDHSLIHDVVFVGGVGNPSHWKRGLETLEYVAEKIPSFRWWGYGMETLPAGSPLIEKYKGEAWGMDMYRIFDRAKVVLNRHGEVAEGYANNMRLFEATGCGAALLTEDAVNLDSFFASGEEVCAYDSKYEAVELIELLLNDEPLRKSIARDGHRRTLRQHTYAERMLTISDSLKGALGLVPEPYASNSNV